MLRDPQTLGRFTWWVLALVLIGLLGGLHPSDRLRDVVLAAAALLVALLNAPAVLAGLRTRAGRTGALLGAASRLLVAAFVLVFVRGVSHEPRGWDEKDAWRGCRGTDVRWPDDPARRCRALHMCIHEAAPGDDVGFRELIAATPECPPP